MNPRNYRLHLEPDLEKFLFSGRVEIDIGITEPISHLILNSKDLAIDSCILLSQSQKENLKFSLDKEKEELNIELNHEKDTDFTLALEFSGKIHSDLMGFYRSKYEHRGETKYIAVTQFEEREARRVFPCVDHPAYKSEFDIEFLINPNLGAIGNTPIVSETLIQHKDGTKKKLVKFEPTPKMCTYILFFGVGEFEYIEDASKLPLVRVAGPPGRVEFGKFGLDVGRKSIDFCEEYMGIPYPLKKMDHIAVADFAFGAMENWGAITYRENLLLVYPGKTSKPALVRLASVIAHETSHMWFGNLVSPLDWKYLWLNESFASYFTYAIPDRYFPEWQMWDQFVLQEMQRGIERDSLEKTPPIELLGDEQIFIDASTAPIIYNKGASILKMLVNYLGEAKYRKGVQHYMQKYQYQCASSAQFWEALENATQEPIQAFADSWVHQPGYPIIEAKIQDSKLVLEQHRFTFRNIDSKQQWIIPLVIDFYTESGENTEQKILMDACSLKVPIPPRCFCVKVNAGQQGFYRVKYEPDALKKLLSLVKTKKIAANDRFGIENDLFALARQGAISVDCYLDAIEENFLVETESLPLLDLAANLRYLYFFNARIKSRIASIGLKIAENALNKIGMMPSENDSVLTADLRNSLLWTAYLFGSKCVKEFALQNFDEYRQNQPVHADILGSVLKIANDALDDAINILKERVTAVSTPESERLVILGVIGQHQIEDHYSELLQFIIEKVPIGNRYIGISSLALNPNSRTFTWDWFVTHHVDFLKYVPQMHIDRIVLNILPYHGLNQANLSEVIDSLGAKYKFLKETLEIAKETIEVNQRFAQ